jgi:hypothetical protein
VSIVRVTAPCFRQARRPRTSTRAAGFLLAATAAVVLLTLSSAEAQPVSVVDLKAVFLFNFAKFTDWPAGLFRDGPLTVCVLGDDAIVRAFNQPGGRRLADGRAIVAAPVEPGGLQGCHVLYLTGLDRKHSQQIIDGVGRTPVLTVSDRESFADNGGVVGVFVVGGRIRFAINVEAAGRAGLTISSRLLNLATIVDSEPVRR